MSDVDIPALVERVRELDKAATPGPWEHNGYDGHPAMAVWTPDPELEDGNSSAKMICREGDYFGEESRAPVEERAENIQLIALYRTAAPVLADEVERLRRELAMLHRVLDRYLDARSTGESDTAIGIVVAETNKESEG